MLAEVLGFDVVVRERWCVASRLESSCHVHVFLRRELQALDASGVAADVHVLRCVGEGVSRIGQLREIRVVPTVFGFFAGELLYGERRDLHMKASWKDVNRVRIVW